MTEAPDPRYMAGEKAVLVDTSKLMWHILADWNGAIDMGANVDKPTMAAQLRYIADQLDPTEATP